MRECLNTDMANRGLQQYTTRVNKLAGGVHALVRNEQFQLKMETRDTVTVVPPNFQVGRTYILYHWLFQRMIVGAPATCTIAQ